MKYEVLNEVTAAVVSWIENSKASGLTESTTLTVSRSSGTIDTPHYVTAHSILREDRRATRRGLAGNSVRGALGQVRDVAAQEGVSGLLRILKEAVEVLTNDDGLEEATSPARVRSSHRGRVSGVNPVQRRSYGRCTNWEPGVASVGDDDQTIYQWRVSDVGQI
jgi:DNA helicase-2/ATP-dependent DNA helicase PcrA